MSREANGPEIILRSGVWTEKWQPSRHTPFVLVHIRNIAYGGLADSLLYMIIIPGIPFMHTRAGISVSDVQKRVSRVTQKDGSATRRGRNVHFLSHINPVINVPRDLVLNQNTIDPRADAVKSHSDT
jgi:hypothetical protein